MTGPSPSPSNSTNITSDSLHMYDLIDHGTRAFTQHLTQVSSQQQRINSTLQCFHQLVDFHLLKLQTEKYATDTRASDHDGATDGEQQGIRGRIRKRRKTGERRLLQWVQTLDTWHEQLRERLADRGREGVDWGLLRELQRVFRVNMRDVEDVAMYRMWKRQMIASDDDDGGGGGGGGIARRSSADGDQYANVRHASVDPFLALSFRNDQSHMQSQMEHMQRVRQFLSVYDDKVRQTDFDSSKGMTHEELTELWSDMQEGRLAADASIRTDIAKEARAEASRRRVEGAMRHSLFERQLQRSAQELFRPNEPTESDHQIAANRYHCSVHRVLVDMPSKLYTCDREEHTAYSVLQTLHSLFGQKMTLQRQSPISSQWSSLNTGTTNEVTQTPSIEELQVLRDRQCDPKLTTEATARDGISPTPLGSDIPKFALRNVLHEQSVDHSRIPSVEQFQAMAAAVLPNLYQRRFEFHNDLNTRGRLVYHLLRYFTQQPSSDHLIEGFPHVPPSPSNISTHLNSWSMVKLLQYPVVVKRNGQYCLVLGIRWGQFKNVQRELLAMENLGLYGLNISRKHFNNFPYFSNSDGREIIRTADNEKGRSSVTSSARWIDRRTPWKEFVQATCDPQRPSSKPFHSWPFEAHIPETSLSPELRHLITTRQLDPITFLLEKNPLYILLLRSQLYNGANDYPLFNGQTQFLTSGMSALEDVWVQSRSQPMEPTQQFEQRFQSSIELELKMNPSFRANMAALLADSSKHELFALVHSDAMVSNRCHPLCAANVAEYTLLLRREMIKCFPWLTSEIMHKASDASIYKCCSYLSSVAFRDMVLSMELSGEVDISQNDNLSVKSQHSKSPMMCFNVREGTLVFGDTMTTNILRQRNVLVDLLIAVEKALANQDNDAHDHMALESLHILLSFAIHPRERRITSAQQALRHPTDAQAKSSVLDRLSDLLPVIRENVHFHRRQYMYLKFFLKGVLVPEKPEILEAYIADKIRIFLKRFSNKCPPTLLPYITLFSRLLNVSTLRKPLRYIQPIPTTRELLSKLANSYSRPLKTLIQPRPLKEHSRNRATHGLIQDLTTTQAKSEAIFQISTDPVLEAAVNRLTRFLMEHWLPSAHMLHHDSSEVQRQEKERRMEGLLATLDANDDLLELLLIYKSPNVLNALANNPGALFKLAILFIIEFQGCTRREPNEDQEKDYKLEVCMEAAKTLIAFDWQIFVKVFAATNRRFKAILNKVEQDNKEQATRSEVLSYFVHRVHSHLLLDTTEQATSGTTSTTTYDDQDGQSISTTKGHPPLHEKTALKTREDGDLQTLRYELSSVSRARIREWKGQQQQYILTRPSVPAIFRRIAELGENPTTYSAVDRLCHLSPLQQLLPPMDQGSLFYRLSPFEMHFNSERLQNRLPFTTGLLPQANDATKGKNVSFPPLYAIEPLQFETSELLLRMTKEREDLWSRIVLRLDNRQEPRELLHKYHALGHKIAAENTSQRLSARELLFDTLDYCETPIESLLQEDTAAQHLMFNCGEENTLDMSMHFGAIRRGSVIDPSTLRNTLLRSLGDKAIIAEKLALAWEGSQRDTLSPDMVSWMRKFDHRIVKICLKHARAEISNLELISSLNALRSECIDFLSTNHVHLEKHFQAKPRNNPMDQNWLFAIKCIVKRFQRIAKSWKGDLNTLNRTQRTSAMTEVRNMKRSLEKFEIASSHGFDLNGPGILHLNEILRLSDMMLKGDDTSASSAYQRRGVSTLQNDRILSQLVGNVEQLMHIFENMDTKEIEWSLSRNESDTIPIKGDSILTSISPLLRTSSITEIYEEEEADNTVSRDFTFLDEDEIDEVDQDNLHHLAGPQFAQKTPMVSGKGLPRSPLQRFACEQQEQYVTENVWDNCDLQRMNVEHAVAFGKAIIDGEKRLEGHNRHRSTDNSLMVQPSVLGQISGSSYIEPHHAVFMSQHKRPSYYHHHLHDKEADRVLPTEKSSVDTIEQLQDVLQSGFDAFRAFGGVGGGHCELLLFSPNRDQRDAGSSEEVHEQSLQKVLQACLAKDLSAVPHISYYGEPGIGWMHLDDIVGPGIDTHHHQSSYPGEDSSKGRKEFIWTGHRTRGGEHIEFKYWPGEKLTDNHEAYVRQRRAKAELQNLTYPDEDLADMSKPATSTLRETIPLYDLHLLFFSALPLPSD